MAARPEEKRPPGKQIGSGEAMRILGIYSYSTLYGYVDSGDLHPKNALPPGKRTGRKTRTLKFEVAEVLRLRDELQRDNDPTD